MLKSELEELLRELSYDEKPCWYQPTGPNRAFKRIGESNQPLTAHELLLLREARQQPTHDRSPVDVPLDRLSEAAVRRLLDEVQQRDPWRRWSAERTLRTLGVTCEVGGRVVPTLAGYLCLAEWPQELFPQLAVAFVRYPTEEAGRAGPGGERFLDTRIIGGPIPAMVSGSIALLKQHMKRRGLIRGIYREDLWEYPEEALREALVNALVHRDYSVPARGTQVQIQMYPDRLEIWNPGGLFGPVSPDALGEPGNQASRNSHLIALATALADRDGRKLCENRGTGIQVMLQRVRDAGLDVPEFRNSISRFGVVLPNHTLLDAETLEWLAERIPSGTDSQRRVLAWMRHRTSSELDYATYRRLTGLDSRVATRELNQLRDLGLIRRRGERGGSRYLLAGAASGAVDASERPAPSRSHDDRILAQLALGERSARELSETLMMKRSTLQWWLRRLRASGRIEHTTASPNDRATKYRLVRAGGI